MYGTINMHQLSSRTAVASYRSEDTECPVCFDSLVPKKTVSPPCAHNICQTCYDGIFIHQTEPSCPLCRASYMEIVAPDPTPEPRTRRRYRSTPRPVPRTRPVPRSTPRPRHEINFDWWGIILIILQIIAGVLDVRR